jgi:tRNA(fMet)-specific endonuclease VapC
MKYLLDTNIIIHILQNGTLGQEILAKYNIFDTKHKPYISIVTIGEIRSMGLQRHWGSQRKKSVEKLLSLMPILNINAPKIIDAYAEIDAYSQNCLIEKPLPTTARNMGKNDLWIAATASVFSLPLITTDADFNHLHDVYLDLHRL